MEIVTMNYVEASKALLLSLSLLTHTLSIFSTSRHNSLALSWRGFLSRLGLFVSRRLQSHLGLRRPKLSVFAC